MDPISYSKASQQEQRIKKFVAQPDSIAGLVTVPNLVPTGETVSIPTGRTLVHPSLQVDGTLDVQGTLFIPSGGSVSTTEVDATVVKQNGNVVANDSTVVHKTGNETIAGVKTFTNEVNIKGDTTIEGAQLNLWNKEGTGIATFIDIDGANNTRIYGILDKPITFHTNSAERLRIDEAGNVLVTGSGGLGYGTGSGGTVTQLTSKSTAVTLNKPCGQIIMNNGSLAAGAKSIFVVNNSLVTDRDIVVLSTSASSDNNDAYTLSSRTLNGLFTVRIINTHAVALAEAVAINFAIIKGATA